MDPSSSLARFVRWVMRDVTYHKLYPATVMAQEGQTLSVLPDDESIQGTGLAKVPMLHGVPGMKAEVKPGARLLLGFRAGDPRRPYVALWESASVSLLTLPNGSLPIARQGDIVNSGGPTTLCYIGMPPGDTPKPVMTGTPYPLYFASAAAPAVTYPYLSGVVASGNPETLG
jgi:hypothetical protein